MRFLLKPFWPLSDQLRMRSSKLPNGWRMGASWDRNMLRSVRDRDTYSYHPRFIAWSCGWRSGLSRSEGRM